MTYNRRYRGTYALYKYATSLNRTSFDVINILSIFSHGLSFEKTSLTT